MRIGFDAKRAFFNRSGLGNYSRDTINILCEQYPENKYFLYTPKNLTQNFLDKEKINYTICTPSNIINRIFPSYWRTKTITNDLLSNRIDIYHGLTHELPLGIEKTNIKTVVTIHDLIFLRHPEFFNKIDRKIYSSKVKSSCIRANKIIAISENTKRDIIELLNIPEEKITVIYQGCNKVFHSCIKKEERVKTLKKYKLPSDYLLYVGNIEERKNLMTLLKTIKSLKTFKLVVIGNGKNYKEKCVEYIKRNNLTNKVFFIHKITQQEIASIYQSAQILIYPSIYEGFGIPILESLYSKTPVITTKNGCFKETGGPNTKYINPLSVAEIKNEVINISSSKETQNKMKEEGIKYAQKFNNAHIGKNLITLYKTL